MGRTSWSDVVRNARGITRIIWFHVPPRVSPRTPDEIAEGVTKRSKEEMLKIMNEKRMALDLVEGFVVALKHHLRGNFFFHLHLGYANLLFHINFLVL